MVPGDRGRRGRRRVRVRGGGRAAGVRRQRHRAGRCRHRGQPREGDAAGDAGRDRAARAGLHRRAAGRSPIWSSPPASPRRTRCWSRRRGGRADLERGRAGLAAQPAGPDRALARHHRHQRQDHHHPDARVDPAPRPGCALPPSATSAGRSWRPCSTPSRTTCSPSSCPATSCTGPTRWPCTPPSCSTCSPTTTSGTAARRATATPRPGSTPASSTAASTTWPIPRPSGWSRRPTSSRAPARSASPSARPGLSMLGVVDDLLVDRAFIEQRRDSALELAKLDDIHPAAPHNVANALAAAALARSYGVPAKAVRDGLRSVRVGAHKIELVAEHGGVSVRRRLQGHQSARGRRVPAGVRHVEGDVGDAPPTGAGELGQGRLDRRRPGQGNDVRRSGTRSSRPGCAVPCCSASIAD